MSAVVDTSALIALHHVRQLRLLPLLFQQVIVPRAVVDEWNEGSAISLDEAGTEEGLLPGWATVFADEDVAEFAATLGRGERQVIAVARSQGAEFVVFDDRAARKAALDAGLRVIGTVGVLVAARGAGLIDGVLPLIETLREVGFRVGDSVMEAARVLDSK